MSAFSDADDDLFGSEEEGEEQEDEAIEDSDDGCSSPEGEGSIDDTSELNGDGRGYVESELEGDDDEAKTLQQLYEEALEAEGLASVGEESDDGKFFNQLDGAVQDQIVRALHKADQGRFSADVETLVLPTPWPVPNVDGSFVYTIFACRLQEFERGSRSAVEQQRQITAGETMTTVQGIRFRVVVPMMVHALTSAGRVDFQKVVGPTAFNTWLAVLHSPTLDSLVVDHGMRMRVESLRSNSMTPLTFDPARPHAFAQLPT